jgi:hypothetical protein
MVKKVTVRGNQRKEPDVRLFVLALIELARQQERTDQNAAATGALLHSTHPGMPSGQPTKEGVRAHACPSRPNRPSTETTFT